MGMSEAQEGQNWQAANEWQSHRMRRTMNQAPLSMYLLSKVSQHFLGHQRLTYLQFSYSCM